MSPIKKRGSSDRTPVKYGVRSLPLEKKSRTNAVRGIPHPTDKDIRLVGKYVKKHPNPVEPETIASLMEQPALWFIGFHHRLLTSNSLWRQLHALQGVSKDTKEALLNVAIERGEIPDPDKFPKLVFPSSIFQEE